MAYFYKKRVEGTKDGGWKGGREGEAKERKKEKNYI